MGKGDKLMEYNEYKREYIAYDGEVFMCSTDCLCHEAEISGLCLWKRNGTPVSISDSLHYLKYLYVPTVRALQCLMDSFKFNRIVKDITANDSCLYELEYTRFRYKDYATPDARGTSVKRIEWTDELRELLYPANYFINDAR